MTQKDGWILGLIALAYLFLDTRAPTAPGTMSDDPRAPHSPSAGEQPASPSRLLPARVVPRDVCPRDYTHAVALRADGAMWCRGCDEGFYPPRAIWSTIMSAAAA